MRLAELENAYASARRRLESATAPTPTERPSRAARAEGEA